MSEQVRDTLNNPAPLTVTERALWLALRIAGQFALTCAAFGALAFALVVVAAVAS